MHESLRTVSVLALELRPPLVLAQTLPVADVVRAMRERGLGYALLTERARLTGIFTERDVFLRILGHPSGLQRPVADCMSRAPVALGADEPVWRAVTLMHERGLRQIPVVDRQGAPLACVRHKDIAAYLVAHFAGHVLTLPPDPHQKARQPEGA